MHKINVYIFLLVLFIYSIVVPHNIHANNKKIDKNYKLFLKGQSFFYQKEYKKALKIFNKLNKKHSATLEYYLKAKSYMLLSSIWLNEANNLNKERRYNHATKAVVEAEKISPLDSMNVKIKKDIKKLKKNNSLKDLPLEKKKQVQSLLQVAKQDLNTGNNEEALKQFANVLFIDNNLTEAKEGYIDAQKRLLIVNHEQKIQELLQQAKALTKKKKYIESISKYRAVQKYDPVHAQALIEIPKLLKLVQAERSLQNKQELALQYLNSGNGYLLQEKFDLAIENYELGQSILPKYTNWGSLIEQAKTKKRLALLRKQKKIQKNIEENYNKALGYIANEQYREAIGLLEKVIIDSNELGLTDLSKQTKTLLKRIKAAFARQDEEVVSMISPYYGIVESFKSAGLNELKKNNYKKANNYFKKILKLFPYHRFANQYTILCKIKLNPQLIDQVLADFIVDIKKSISLKKFVVAERSIQVGLFIDPKNQTILDFQKIVQKQIKILQRKESPETINKWWKQAFQLQNTDKKSAIALANRIIVADPTFSKAKSLLIRLGSKQVTATNRNNISANAKKAYTQGILFYNSGNIPKALRAFQRALRLAPNFTNARNALNKCRIYLKTRG